MSGVLFGCAIPTGGGIILNETSINKNSLVGVIGIGGIGLSAFIAAKCLNPKHLIAIDVEKEKLKLAKKLGATEILNVNKHDIVDNIKKITQNKGLDIVIEAAGLTKTIELGFDIIKRNGGKLIFASHPKNGDKISLDPFDLISGKKISGSCGVSCFPDIDIQRLNDLFLKNKISLDFLLTQFTNLKKSMTQLKI